MLKIDKGVPIPERQPGTTREFFDTLEIGDSVLIEMANRPPDYARKLAHRMGGNRNGRFISRKVEDGNVRIYCVHHNYPLPATRKRSLEPRR